MSLTIREMSHLCRVLEKRCIQEMRLKMLPRERREVRGLHPAAGFPDERSPYHQEYPVLLPGVDLHSSDRSPLASALERGGRIRDVAGHDSASVMHNLVAAIPLSTQYCRGALVELCLAREALGYTIVSEGVILPHPLCPIVFPGIKSALRLCYFENPIRFGARKQELAQAILFLVVSTRRSHLHLLARLACLLRETSFQEAIAHRVPQDALVDQCRQLESQLLACHRN